MKWQSADNTAILDPEAKTGHVQSLDGLRAISILLVLLGHFLLPPQVAGISGFGVTVFFFISGLLITRLLFAEIKANGEIDIKNFYLRRILRLYPVIVVSILMCVVLTSYRGEHVDKVEIASVFLYFTNYLVVYREAIQTAITMPIGPFWSLSVEEHFYLLFPAIFVLLRGQPFRIAQVAVATCVVCLSLRCLYLFMWPEWIGTLATYWRSETRFDSIAFGVLLAALCEMPERRRFLQHAFQLKTACVATLILVASFAFRNSFYQDTVRFTIHGIVLFPIVGYLVFSARPGLSSRFLNSPIMTWIGQLSYSLYIWHGAVIFLLSGFAYAYLPPSAYHLFMFLFSFVAAAISYYTLEMPFMGLRRRLRRSPTKRQDAVPPPAVIQRSADLSGTRER